MAIRRLPVIQQPTGEDAEAASRPSWQWVLIGSGLLVTMWTPVVLVGLALATKVLALRGGGSLKMSEGLGVVAPLVAASTLALAGVATGYLVARFGPQTRLRHAAFAGLAAAVELWLLALRGGGLLTSDVALSVFLSLSVLSAAFCALGAWLQRRKKLPGRAGSTPV